MSSPTDGPLRSLHVLEVLAGMEQPANLDMITAATGLPRTKTYRSLRGLQDDGFVDHVGRDGYRVGSRSLALATLIGPRPALLHLARPVLRWLADISSEWASLHLRSGSHRVLVLAAEPRDTRVRGSIHVGERAPLTSGCSGTSILAFLPEAEAQSVIDGRPARERRPTTRQLNQIRADGYAMSFSTNHAGINGVGVPLLSPVDRAPLGSLSIAGAEKRLSKATLRQLSEPMKKAANQLAPRLAKLLGPNSSEPLSSLDVTLQDFLPDELDGGRGRERACR